MIHSVLNASQAWPTSLTIFIDGGVTYYFHIFTLLISQRSSTANYPMDAPSPKANDTPMNTKTHEADRLLISQSPNLSSDDESHEHDVVLDYPDKLLSIDIETSDIGIGASDTVDLPVAPPFSWKKLWQFTGPGFLMSIAFLDPGNLEGDLQAGAIAGYSLLWLLMWSTVMGLLIQLLSARLGVVTGRPMAEICREEYPPWARMMLWFMAELALIGADIQEVIGSAIAINILSNGVLPLWAGVIITASDCFIFLCLENYGIRKLEAFFAFLITTMALSFAWMFADTKPDKKELLVGLLVPRLSSRTIKKAVGVVGCVITPHNVFLYSALVQSRKVDPKKRGQVQEALNYYTIESSIAVFVTFMINLFVTTVFAKGFYGTRQAKSIGLLNAGNYLQERYGGGIFPMLYIWGIGLLAAGQSSTLTGTYAGQFIMEGFLDIRLKKWGMQIPFALIPLLILVADEHLMGVFRIGPVFERIVWSVAALVIVINGYVLLDFFFSEVDGLLFGILVCVGVATYITFILYLMSQGNALPSHWFNAHRSKGFAYTAQ